jgi:VWFA-related protein
MNTPGPSRRSLLLGIPFLLRAQDPKFSTDVSVVTVLATVRDRDGHIVKDLGREDFQLQEDAKPQTISYFSRESNLPLTIGLLVDTSRSQIRVMERERTATYKFLDQVLREDKDRAFVAHFDTRVEILQGLTSSRKELDDALARLAIPGEAATLIYEAIRQTSESPMRPQPGRKAFILLSDGVAFRDHTSIGTAIEFAQRADTMIFSILFAGPLRLAGPGGIGMQAAIRQHGKSVMQRLARETGGAFYEVSAHNSIEQIYAAIEDTLRNQYSIGFTPQSPGKSGQYHKIKLTARKPGLIVQTRDGYYSR